MADTVITPTLVYPTNLSVPTPGDNVKAATPPGAVRPGYQALLDGVASAQAQLFGGGFRRIITGLSSTVMHVDPIGAVTVTNGGIWKTFPHLTRSTLSPLVLAGGAFTAGVRYFVYAYDNAGTLDFLASSGSPTDACWRFNGTNTDLFYVTSFLIDLAGNFVLFNQSDNIYSYADAVNGNRVLNAGAALAFTTVSVLTNIIVPGVLGNGQVRSVRLLAKFLPAVANDAIQISPVGGTVKLSMVAPVAGIELAAEVNITTMPTTRAFDYVVTNTASPLSVWVTEYVS